jgi:acyl-CoA reductase-like NAD-dependent aldehyde dehydrogenase
MASQEPTIQRLRAAITDGRTANIRYRQKELQSLHAALSEYADELASAIANDTGATSAEVEAEIYLTMDSLRNFYDGLDFEKKTKEEYLVANGKNNIERRIGVGLVAIKPTFHTRTFSILSPICAAVAAGNCVLLEVGTSSALHNLIIDRFQLEQTTSNVDKLLKEILTKALDQDAVAITTSSTSSLELPSHILVDQTSSNQASKTNELLSSTTSRTVAIVDRTADIETAAKAIVTARFSFQGTSPYAPDLVIVNEWVKKDFFEACTKYATQLFSSKGSAKPSSSNASKETAEAVKKAEANGQLSTFGSADFKVVDISDR